MATITPEVAEKLAESWSLHPDYRARFNTLLNQYLDQCAGATEMEMERVFLVEVADYWLDADELAREREGKLHAAKGV